MSREQNKSLSREQNSSNMFLFGSVNGKKYGMDLKKKNCRENGKKKDRKKKQKNMVWI